MAVRATTESPNPAASEEAKPETPGQSGADAGANRSDPTPSSGATAKEQETRVDYFREAFQRMRSGPQAPPVSGGSVREPERPEGEAATGVPSSAEATGGSSGQAPSRQQKRDSKPSAGEPITLTQEELDRRVQAESDRKLAKLQQDERLRREREEEAELRKNNPFEYVRRLEQKEAELREQREETSRISGLLDGTIHQYDRDVLDVFVGVLPNDVRQKILDDAEEGIPGRGKIAKGTFEALKKIWLNEGAKTARDVLAKDPTFVKEILARHGGQREEPDPPSRDASIASPEPTNSNGRMNNWMRQEGRRAAVTR
jgi:hypothetical protein